MGMLEIMMSTGDGSLRPCVCRSCFTGKSNQGYHTPCTFLTCFNEFLIMLTLISMAKLWCMIVLSPFVEACVGCTE